MADRIRFPVDHIAVFPVRPLCAVARTVGIDPQERGQQGTGRCLLYRTQGGGHLCPGVAAQLIVGTYHQVGIIVADLDGGADPAATPVAAQPEADPDGPPANAAQTPGCCLGGNGDGVDRACNYQRRKSQRECQYKKGIRLFIGLLSDAKPGNA